MVSGFTRSTRWLPPSTFWRGMRRTALSGDCRRCRCAIPLLPHRATPPNSRLTEGAAFFMPPTALKMCWLSSPSMRQAALLPRCSGLDAAARIRGTLRSIRRRNGWSSRIRTRRTLQCSRAIRSKLSRGRAGCRLVRVDGFYERYSFRNGSSECTRLCVDPSKTSLPPCNTMKLVSRSASPLGSATIVFFSLSK
jgi:hypothetical protein